MPRAVVTHPKIVAVRCGQLQPCARGVRPHADPAAGWLLRDRFRNRRLCQRATGERMEGSVSVDGRAGATWHRCRSVQGPSRSQAEPISVERKRKRKGAKGKMTAGALGQSCKTRDNHPRPMRGTLVLRCASDLLLRSTQNQHKQRNSCEVSKATEKLRG